MNWDEDIDLTTSKKVAPKLGRRAANLSPGKIEGLLDSPEEAFGGDSPPQAVLKPRRTGKWGDEGGKSAKGRNGVNLIELERFENEKIESDNDDDIPVIPDIEELQDYSTSPVKVIQTSKAAAIKHTYKALDSELVNLSSTQTFGVSTDVNLSVLLSKLCPERDVKDPDEEWSTKDLIDNFISFTNKTS